MTEVPFELRYQLSRRQRLVPHLRAWGGAGWSLIFVAFFTFLCLMAAVSIWSWDWMGFAGVGGMALGMLVLCRGLFIGLLDVLLVPVRGMDIKVEENSLGILIRGERWLLFLDGLTSIDQLAAGVWTLRHWNGWVVHIPTAAITTAQLAHLRAAMEGGRTPEGRRAVLERGRLIMERQQRQQGDKRGRESN